MFVPGEMGGKGLVAAGAVRTPHDPAATARHSTHSHASGARTRTEPISPCQAVPHAADLPLERAGRALVLRVACHGSGAKSKSVPAPLGFSEESVSPFPAGFPDLNFHSQGDSTTAASREWDVPSRGREGLGTCSEPGPR